MSYSYDYSSYVQLIFNFPAYAYLYNLDHYFVRTLITGLLAGLIGILYWMKVEVQIGLETLLTPPSSLTTL